MEWPSPLLRAFDQALHILDASAQRAVWRVHGNPSKLYEAYTVPRTPLDLLLTNFIDGLVTSLEVDKEAWNIAVDMLQAYVREYPQLIYYYFRSDPASYNDQVPDAP